MGKRTPDPGPGRFAAGIVLLLFPLAGCVAPSEPAEIQPSPLPSGFLLPAARIGDELRFQASPEPAPSYDCRERLPSGRVPTSFALRLVGIENTSNRLGERIPTLVVERAENPNAPYREFVDPRAWAAVRKDVIQPPGPNSTRGPTLVSSFPDPHASSRVYTHFAFHSRQVEPEGSPPLEDAMSLWQILFGLEDGFDEGMNRSWEYRTGDYQGRTALGIELNLTRPTKNLACPSNELYTVWLSPRVPYPVRLDAADGVWSESGYRRVPRASGGIALYEAGTERVPLEPATPPRLLSAFGPGTDLPDGRMPESHVSLRRADELARGDATLRKFAAWRASYTDYELVGAIGGSTDWALQYATPQGSAIRVFIRGEDPSAGVNWEMEPQKIPRFAPGPRGAAYVTIESAIALWRSIAPPNLAAKEPNAFTWGYQQDQCASDFCPMGDSRDYIRIGLRESEGTHVTDNPGGTPVLLWVQPAWEADSLLKLNATEPRLLSASHRTTSRPPLGGSAPAHGAGLEASDSASRGFVPGLRPHDEWPILAAGGTAVALGVLAYWLRPWILWRLARGLAFIPAYAKILRRRVLDQPTRQAIVERVESSPGITLSELVIGLGTRWSVLLHHVRTLERNQAIHLVPAGRHRRAYPAAWKDSAQRRRHATLLAAGNRAAWELVSKNPGIAQRDVARRLGVAAPSALRRLRALQRLELVRSERRAGSVRYYAEPSPEAFARSSN